MYTLVLLRHDEEANPEVDPAELIRAAIGEAGYGIEVVDSAQSIAAHELPHPSQFSAFDHEDEQRTEAAEDVLRDRQADGGDELDANKRDEDMAPVHPGGVDGEE